MGGGGAELSGDVDARSRIGAVQSHRRAPRARKALATAFATKCAPALKRALAVCDAETAASYEAGEVYDITAEQAGAAPERVAAGAGGAVQVSTTSLNGTPRRACARARPRNMTETVAALGALSKSGIVSDDPASDTMASTRALRVRRVPFETWRDDANVSCTYLGLVAGLSASASPGVAALVPRSGEENVALANVRAVSENHDSEFHGVYDAKVPTSSTP